RRSSLLPEDMGSGVCFVDVDGDGRDDLFFVDAVPLEPAQRQGPARNALYLNRGDGTFAAVASSAVPQGLPSGMGCLFFDAEGRGRRDLLLTAYEGDRFYRALGGGRFEDATRASGFGDARWGAGACAADYDGDGRLDAYVPRYVDFRRDRVPTRTAAERGGYTIPVALSPHAFPAVGGSLYRDEGGGRFRDAAARAGALNADGKGLQCLWADFDQDGRPDLYVADDVTPDRLLRNRGGGTFADATNEAWLGDVKSSMGLALGDFDGDGDEDLAVTQWIAHEKSLYINLLDERRGKDAPGRHLHFADGNAAAGLGESTLDNVGWGVLFLDYDDDGRLDLMIANGSTFESREDATKLVPQRLQLFHNQGDGTFRDVSEQAGPAFRVPLDARGLAAADYDGDGRVDVAVSVNGGRALLLHNAVRNGNRWLELSLRGRGTRRDAVGARVVVTTPDGRRQTRSVSAGGSYLSQSSYALHFGLGKAATADRVEILWPSGRRQVLTGVAADRRLEVAEPGS
ncbi:MAG: CRTAC1 family protein, partial [Elusimicrobia bacterium]|nr:CRTAC1 family protein [Elusimicrobiota bacterium]